MEVGSLEFDFLVCRIALRFIFIIVILVPLETSGA